MSWSRSVFPKALAVAGLAIAALAAAPASQARSVYWSVGVDAAPGVSVGVANHRPVVIHPAPVYVQQAPVYVVPQPVYVQPRVIYTQPRVIYTQPQVVYSGPTYSAAPAQVYYGPPGHWKHKHKHKHHKRWNKHHGWDD